MYNKKNSNHWNAFRGVSLALSVLTLSLAVSYFASAWTEPSDTPPDGNASAPLNVSSIDQSKEGRIGIGGVFAPSYSLDIRDSLALGTLRTTGGALLNTGGAATGLIVDSGNVGIGTTTVPGRLTINGEPSGGDNAGVFTIFDYTAGMGDINMTGGADSLFAFNNSGDAVNGATYFRSSSSGVGSILYLKNNGNVGIGTTSPSAKFEVRGVDDINVDWSTSAQSGLSGTIRVVNENSMINLISSNESFSASAVGLSEVNSSTGAYQNIWALWRETTNATGGGDGDFHISYDDTDADAWWHSAGVNMFTIKTNGNVGIGTTSPGAKLQVSGGDIAVSGQGNGLILKATDGANCYRVTVNNAGVLSTALVACP